jgi:hypothetical protein
MVPRRHCVIVIGIWLGVAIAAARVETVVAEDNAIRSAPVVDQSRSTDHTIPAVEVPRQCICTMEYNPVCGRTPNGAEITFSNPCRARCAGATAIRPGPC